MQSQQISKSLTPALVKINQVYGAVLQKFNDLVHFLYTRVATVEVFTPPVCAYEHASSRHLLHMAYDSMVETISLYSDTLANFTIYYKYLRSVDAHVLLRLSSDEVQMRLLLNIVKSVKALSCAAPRTQWTRSLRQAMAIIQNCTVKDRESDIIRVEIVANSYAKLSMLKIASPREFQQYGVFSQSIKNSIFRSDGNNFSYVICKFVH